MIGTWPLTIWQKPNQKKMCTKIIYSFALLEKYLYHNIYYQNYFNIETELVISAILTVLFVCLLAIEPAVVQRANSCEYRHSAITFVLVS